MRAGAKSVRGCSSERNTWSSELLGVSSTCKSLCHVKSAYQVADTSSRPRIGFGDRKNSGMLQESINEIVITGLWKLLTGTICLVVLLWLLLNLPVL